jgi:FAD linked oxidases, C-terminal domain
MEVVLPNGEVMRTGMGALPGNNTWQLFQYGYGPYCDGIFSQSNYGICTKMGVWLMPPPEGYQVFLFTFPREEDLHQLVEIIRPLRIANVIANVPHVRHALEECAVQGTRREWCPEVVGAVPDDVLEKMTEKLWMGKCRWLYYGCVYGPEAFRKAQLEAIKDAFFQIKGAKLFFPEDSPPNSYLRSRVNIYTGTPDLRELDWVNWRTNGGHIAFSPVSPVRGEDAVKQFALCKKICDKYGFDFLSTYCVGMREMHHIAEIIFDKGDPDGKRKVLACCRELIAEAAKLGYGEYRTHLILQDQVAATYNWNNNV